MISAYDLSRFQSYQTIVQALPLYACSMVSLVLRVGLSDLPSGSDGRASRSHLVALALDIFAPIAFIAATSE